MTMIQHWKAIAGVAATMIAVHVVNLFTGGYLSNFGIEPRAIGGAYTIATAPFIHGDLAHLGQLLGNRPGVSGKSARAARSADSGDLRHLHGAGHSVRELHSPGDDPHRTSLRSIRSAAGVAGFQNAARCLRVRGFDPACRHREKERNHDDRLCAGSGANTAHPARPGDRSGGRCTLSPDHDDDDGSADGDSADCTRSGSRCGISAAAWSGSRRRIGVLAARDTVCDASVLHLFRRVARPGAGSKQAGSGEDSRATARDARAE